MPPRRKAPTPSGSTDGESDDFHTAPPFNPGVAQIATDIEALRSKRTQIRKSIEADHNKKIIRLEARITKHYENEAQKRSQLFTKKLERLTKAIEKRTACEEAIRKLLSSLAGAAETLAQEMHTIHTSRQSATQNAATFSFEGKGKMRD